MSDCSTRAWRKPSWGDAKPHEPMKSPVPYERRSYTVVWDSGETTENAYSAYAKGAGGGFYERRIERFEQDGERFERARECVMTRTFRGSPCNDYKCSACGKTHCAERAHEHCPRCGAACVKVVDEDGHDLPRDNNAASVDGRAL